MPGGLLMRFLGASGFVGGAHRRMVAHQATEGKRPSCTFAVPVVIPGRALWRKPGIHFSTSLAERWIPGSRFARRGMTGFIAMQTKAMTAMSVALEACHLKRRFRPTSATGHMLTPSSRNDNFSRQRMRTPERARRQVQ